MRRCAYEGCEKEATQLASGREHDYPRKPGHHTAFYCAEHGSDVADEGNPEYTVCCPHCDCLFGVN